MRLHCHCITLPIQRFYTRECENLFFVFWKQDAKTSFEICFHFRITCFISKFINTQVFFGTRTLYQNIMNFTNEIEVSVWVLLFYFYNSVTGTYNPGDANFTTLIEAILCLATASTRLFSYMFDVHEFRSFQKSILIIQSIEASLLFTIMRQEHNVHGDLNFSFCRRVYIWDFYSIFFFQGRGVKRECFKEYIFYDVTRISYT